MIQNNNKKTFKMFLLEQIYSITNFNSIILYFAIFIVLLNVLLFQYLQLIELTDYYKIVNDDYLNLLKQLENISFLPIEKNIEINELNQQLDNKIKKELENFSDQLTDNEIEKLIFISSLYILFFITSMTMAFYFGHIIGLDF